MSTLKIMDTKMSDNDQSMKRMIRAMQLSQGQFSLILAYCNYEYLRQEVMQEIIAQSSLNLQLFMLPKSATTLYTSISRHITENRTLSTLINRENNNIQPHLENKTKFNFDNFAIIIFGLYNLESLDELLTSTNQVRDEFRRSFPFPIVLWVTEEVVSKMIRLAPDFKSWAAATIKFEPSTTELFNLLRRQTDAIFDLPNLPNNQALNLPDKLPKKSQLLSSIKDAKNSPIITHSFLHNITSNWRKSIADNFQNFGLDSTIDAAQIDELELALKDLENRGKELESSVKASLDFILGLDDYANNNFSEALEHYQCSYRFWQAETNQEIAGNWQVVSSIIRQGIVLFHIALCYRHQAEKNPVTNRCQWLRARDSFEESITLFEQAQRPDLAAGTMIYLGEVLQHLEDWIGLQLIAENALSLYFNYLTPAQLAQNNGFLAEIYLHQNSWEQARFLAELALSILANEPKIEGKKSQRAPYLLLLAKTQLYLGEAPGAIENLTLALDQTNSQENPRLYIKILTELRSLYSERGEYLKAFLIKQQQRSIEQQFGFRAFSGAIPLTSKPNPTSVNGKIIKQDSTATTAITASYQRQKDIDHLLQRIGRDDRKLTIIHGPSGVGKSSLVNAGLVPALTNSVISARNILPVVVQTYSDWYKELNQRLNETVIKLAKDHPALNLIAQERQAQFRQNSGKNYPIPIWFPAQNELIENRKNGDNFGLETGNKYQQIIRNLQEHNEYNFITVLIFDQFEEFFFAIADTKERLAFYDFLKDCLNVPFVKVILALREDYLHYLLEWDRLTNWDVINNNILDKSIRYSLSDFSMDDAKFVIQSLTERAQFFLEPELIDTLVKDLADEQKQVRPIELQVVGAQLQETGISTLKQYQALGKKPKDVLIRQSIEQVIEDCGKPYEEVAWEILYSLTDGKGTRPIKTKQELARVYHASAKDDQKNRQNGSINQLEMGINTTIPHSLDLMLEIWVGSGLLLMRREAPEDRYQLMHDYLVHPIRCRYGIEDRLRQAQVEKRKAQAAQKMSQEQLYQANRNLKRLLGTAVAGVILLAGSTFSAIGFWQRAEVQKQRADITTMAAGSEALFVANNRFDALMESLRAAKKLQQLEKKAGKEYNLSEIKMSIAASLQQSVYGVKEHNRLEGHNDMVWAVAYNPDGKTIASGGCDETIKIWGLDGKLLQDIRAHKACISDISFSPDGKILASASQDKTIKLWQIQGNKPTNPITLIGHTAKIKRISFSPHGEFLASVGEDKTIKIWGMNGQLLQTIPQNSIIESVSVNPEGNLIATSAHDGTVKLWSLDGKLVKSVEHSNLKSIWPNNDPEALKVYQVSFSRDGQLLASAGADGTIKIWTVGGVWLRTIAPTGENLPPILTVLFTNDGQAIASGSQDGTINIWELDGHLRKTFKGHNDQVTNMSFSPDGQTLASASYDKTVKLWEVSDRTLQILAGHTDRVLAASVSPDSQLIASASQDNTVKLWDRSGNLLRKFTGHKDRVTSVNFSPDGQFLVSGSYDKTVKIWSIATGKLVKTLTGHTDTVMYVTCSPNGQFIASGSKDHNIKIWSSQGKLLRTLKGHTGWVNSLSFSPDSKTLVSGSDDKTVKIWSVNGILLKSILAHRSFVLGVSFSPHGNEIASAGYDNTIKLWNLNGELQATLLKGSSDSVTGISFSPDGQLIASSSFDKTVKLWSRHGNLLKILRGHQDSVMGVNFSPDGKFLVSASRDNNVIIWDLDLEELWIKGCHWIEDYLKTNPNVGNSDRTLCDR